MLARILYCIVEKFDGGLNLMNIRSVSDVISPSILIFLLALSL